MGERLTKEEISKFNSELIKDAFDPKLRVHRFRQRVEQLSEEIGFFEKGTYHDSVRDKVLDRIDPEGASIRTMAENMRTPEGEEHQHRVAAASLVIIPHGIGSLAALGLVAKEIITGGKERALTASSVLAVAAVIPISRITQVANVSQELCYSSKIFREIGTFRLGKYAIRKFLQRADEIELQLSNGFKLILPKVDDVTKFFEQRNSLDSVDKVGNAVTFTLQNGKKLTCTF